MRYKLFLFCILCVLTPPVWAQNTYYISSSLGSDSNTSTQAQSKATPWAHAPGMANCALNCASYTPIAGDQFIFRGGDTWNSASFLWTWRWAGTAANQIYIGVDKTWFAGASWTRPILNGSNLIHQFVNTTPAVKYIQFDNFEFTGMFSDLNPPGWGSIFYFNGGGASANADANVKLSNNYFHGWNVTHDGAQAAVAVLWGAGGTDRTSSMFNNVIDGSDVCTPPGPCTMCGVYGGPPIIYNNYVGYLSNGMVVNWTTSVHDNLIEWVVLSPDNPTDHPNGFESNGDTNLRLYNNVVRHIRNAGVVIFQMAPSAGSTSIAFNNVLYDVAPPNLLQCYTTAGTCVWYNNTEECGPDAGVQGQCIRADNTGGSTAENNHFVTSSSGTSWNGGAHPATLITNTVQTKGVANGQGYTAAQTYGFSPTLVTNATVGTGTNLSNLCAQNGGSLPNALCSDTTYAVSHNTSDHTVSWPARTPVARPISGTWDAGAYQFGQSAVVRPMAPTSLAAVVK